MIDQGTLQQIQSLQFVDKPAAEYLLRLFLAEVYPEDIDKVELRPLAVSLNSFNGFLTLKNGKRYFFKTHTEADTVISEYYNAKQLANAGYPVITPIFSSTKVGQQLLVYELIEDKSVFDIAWLIEKGDNSQYSNLTVAQNTSDQLLLDLYFRSIQPQTSEMAKHAAIHQLFYHRLVGGRLDRFYGYDRKIELPDKTYTMKEIRAKKWIINNQVYDKTLDEIIDNASQILFPKSSEISIIGHGDAHNGNVFFRNNDGYFSLLYFDPAFAGRHNPFLDMAKPLFHNVFAMWMYFPDEKRITTRISMSTKGDTIVVDYEYFIHPVRHMFLKSKIENVLIPLLIYLKQHSTLPLDWREYLKLALSCCPLLTMDLTDRRRFSPEIGLLGLAMAVEMGAESRGKTSYLDNLLDMITDQIM